MSGAIFDCSQFLSFDKSIVVTSEDLVGFEQLRFRIIRNDCIEDVKLNYIEEYMMDETIELFEQEFQGDLRDWELIDHPTPEVIRFVEVVQAFGKKTGMTDLIIYFISCASEDKSEDVNFIEEVSSDEIYKGLYMISKYTSDHNLILKIHFT